MQAWFTPQTILYLVVLVGLVAVALDQIRTLRREVAELKKASNGAAGVRLTVVEQEVASLRRWRHDVVNEIATDLAAVELRKRGFEPPPRRR